jgi:hypothetical protein
MEVMEAGTPVEVGTSVWTRKDAIALVALLTVVGLACLWFTA